ncbi:MAG: TauD/TfdA family dioxygenase [Thalassobaculaceae bacterium]|nr:TauD/TfdA family dioxygenase [Thalassobaculaceae bacterium]
MATAAPKIAMPDGPVDDPSVWLAEDLERDDRWIHRLTDGEIVELDRAVEGVLSRGLAAEKFERDDFPLTSLADTIAGWANEIDNGRGVVLVRGLDAQRYDEDALLALYWGIGVHLGLPVAQNAKGDLLGHVRDKGNNYQANNVRGYTTSAQLKAHCDAADVVGLLCRHPSKSGGESLIASSLAVYNHILKEHPEYLPHLMAGFHFDLRGEGATDNPNETTFHKVPVFSWFEGRMSCRYNGKTITDGMRKAGEPLEGIALEAVQAVGEIAMSKPFRYDMAFEQGDMQLLSNHTVLHARSSFEDWPDEARKRDLWRLWLNLRDGRPLDRDFADRMNTGPRGGVRVRAQAAE